MNDKTIEPGTPPVIGVLGGSGVYDIDGLTDRRWRRIWSSFGAPSDEIMEGVLDGQKVLFMPRHGRGHPLPPSDLNYRANIDALKRAGATEILSLPLHPFLSEGDQTRVVDAVADFYQSQPTGR